MRNQDIRSKLLTIITCALFSAALVLLPSLAAAQISDRPDKARFVPDVRGQFRALTHRADALGFHIGRSPDPSTCRHYQAITRVDGANGTPFFLATRNGNKSAPFCQYFDSPTETENGHLIVFRMDSRDKNGERLRSNRLQKGVHVNDTPPDARDSATTYFTVVGGDPNDPNPAKRPGLVRNTDRDIEGIPPRVYQHPGGMQLVGDVLALVVEKPRRFSLPENICSLCVANPQSPGCSSSFAQQCLAYEPAPDPTMVMFFDVSDPENPRFLSRFVPYNSGGVFENAGVVAVTPMPDGAYLMAVSGGNNRPMFFFRSTVNDLKSPALGWQPMGQSNDIATPDYEDHQTLQFIREGNINGRLYLAGARNDALLGGKDRLDLYRVICATQNCLPGENISLDNGEGAGYNGQLILPFPNTGGTRLANLAAASGFYISPSGELLFYATEHDNDGPNETVKAGEWRHREIVRPDSPTLRPTARVFGTYTVDEGSSVIMSGEAKPPITKAFIQLYHDTDYGSFYPVVDYADFGLDNYDDFFHLEYTNEVDHQNKASSWNWFAPPGCSILAIDRFQNAPDETRTLYGEGIIRRDPDLLAVLNDGGTDDINEEIDGIDFLDGCDSYYSTPFNLFWDLDLNGSFESSGQLVSFNSAAFDGPTVVAVPVRAAQQASGGSGAGTSAVVSVRNVAPQLAPLRITNNAGQVVNTAVPFVLTKVPINAAANFSDPGLRDHQTATLNWGDGAIEQQNAFSAFNDAYGDGSGTISHAHRYNAPGLYQITLSVRDDDGGENIKTFALRVRNPEQAVVEVVALLDNLIASTTNNNIRRHLDKAHKALAGSNGNSNNGALNKIRAGNTQAALTFIRQAVDDLRRAAAEGADVALLITLLEQTAASLSAQ